MRSRLQFGFAAVLTLGALGLTVRTSAQQTTNPPAVPPAAATTPDTPTQPPPETAPGPVGTNNDPTASPSKKPDPKQDDKAKPAAPKSDPLPSPGEALDPHIKKGSEDDVDAVGTRNIGGRGMGNWYSTDWEIRVGKQYSMEIEKSAHLITDPVIVEYVNRVGQNLVKNSDAKVPFTIKVIDSDEINAMALPGGFFYVNSGLIMNCDEEAELAGVMAHEI